MQTRTAVITGGASGIGRSVAKQLAKEGCQVHVLDYNITAFDEENISAHKCDVRDQGNIVEIIKLIEEVYDHIDYLFTCAGIHYHGYVDAFQDDDFEDIMKTNVYGTYYTVKAVLPLMKHNGGSIVIMGSDQSVIAKPKNAVYAMTKGALSQFAKGLAIDHAQHGIRVNCICPGTIETKMYENAIGKASKLYNRTIEEIKEEDRNAQPIKRIGTAEEVAKAVVFLLSDQSSYVTGTDFIIDGGYTCQ